MFFSLLVLPLQRVALIIQFLDYFAHTYIGSCTFALHYNDLKSGICVWGVGSDVLSNKSGDVSTVL